MSLPSGWENRHNTMSEKDMKLGGAAATRFSSSGVYGDAASTYKTSDQVRSHYHKNLLESPDSSLTSGLPSGWEQRQKKLEVDEKQHGAFSRHPPLSRVPSEPASAKTSGAKGNDASHSTAESALVQVTTYSMDALARTLETDPSISISLEDRTAFANAAKRVMNALELARNREPR